MSRRSQLFILLALSLFLISCAIAGVSFYMLCRFASLVLIGYLLYLWGIRSGISKQKRHEAAPEASAALLLHHDQELSMARRVQDRLLSVEVDVPAGLKVAKRCVPAEAIGGDFYTFINKNVNELTQVPRQKGIVEYVDSSQSYFGVVMGDVAGHGVSSALVMALSSGIFMEVGYTTKSPAKTLENANMSILHFIEQTHISYVTVFYGVINPERREFIYARAGHPPALLLTSDGEVELLTCEGLFLGMFEGETYEEVKRQLNQGDRLYFYTDGLTEAISPENEQFGQDRLIEIIKATRNIPIDQSLDRIFHEVEFFCEKTETRDDRTMVIVEFS